MEAPPRDERAPSEPAARGGEIDSSRPPCRFFLLGKCKFGNSCTFSHQPRGRLPVCRFFEKTGSCRYGRDCKFLHGGPSVAATATATTTTTTAAGRGEGEGVGEEAGEGRGASGAGAGAATAVGHCGHAGGGEHEHDEHTSDAAEDTCGICLENIPASGKRFGLLNCDHVYCLECLRTWRKSKGPQKDISRTCPECRKVSFFLVPSKEHLKGKAKGKAIQEYKKGLSKLPCKYHKPGGTTICPFGPRCFYAHLDESGVDVKDHQPPNPLAPVHRACPYLRGGGGRGAGRGGGSGGERHGSDRGDINHFHDIYTIDPGEMRFVPDMRDSHGHAVIMRLRQLILNANEF